MQKKLLEIIVCPFCYTRLFMNDTETELICNIENISFPLKQGIPVLLKNQIRYLNCKIIDNQ
ncbi:Trm112p-like protein; tRNA methylation [Candidatus Blochmanniella floridana]|uniref:Methyltransferase activator Trm112 homolog n=1 Tax=Blochmanniella floridana TaxID=203907 RepID=Y377_BLOFL|nr:RecName: Full=UPF0434 protein Bfl377 [Candidatus Blochmannia floridanus]CAD83443.1 Trm112p-like protein; tRNA methylation [Candidatus Blochmannia floridanus]